MALLLPVVAACCAVPSRASAPLRPPPARPQPGLCPLDRHRNLVKGVSERKGDRTTPAMRLEITPRPWSWKDVLARRLFPGRLNVPEPWMRIYRREWITPAVGRNTRHELRHAF